jgi:hypothetical protein
MSRKAVPDPTPTGFPSANRTLALQPFFSGQSDPSVVPMEQTRGEMAMRDDVRHRGSVSARRAIAALVIIAFLHLLHSAEPAAALSSRGRSGYPGAVQVGPVAGWAGDNWLGIPAKLSVGQVRVDRSRAWTGTQRITIQYRYWRWGGSWDGGQWIHAASARDSRDVAPGYYASFPGSVFKDGGSYWYGVDMVVTWTTSTGSFLGRVTIDYDAISDYACMTAGVSCNVQVLSASAGAGIWLKA